MTRGFRFQTIARIAGGSLAALCATTLPATAHPGHGPMSGLAAGSLHPFSGLDHLLAMVAVGLWAGASESRIRWLWPAAFVGCMIVGGIIGMSGVSLGTPEPIILASVFILGLAVAFGVRAPLGLGAGLIGLFGLAHGYAHGAEMPHNVGALEFAAGFTLATATLHATGVAAATNLRRWHLNALTRFAGAGIAMAGIGLIFGV